MLFNSYIFIFIFLPLSLFIYYFFLKKNKLNLAQLCLLISSLFFYGWWNYYYLLLLILSILLNYNIGIILILKKSKIYLTLGILLNLSILFYYKYFNFFIDNFNHFFHRNFLFEDIILPLGISFFTFQQISFLIESYSGSFKDVKFVKYSVFVSFFPQLIAGPITRFKNFYPQLLSLNINNISRNLSIGITIFALGLFKKVFIADSISNYVDNGFSAVNFEIVLTFAESWIAAILYSFQLYFDFSGYSDMAFGLAFMFGFTIPINFLSPFKSKNIKEFWNKWHISLSSFARDYLFYPIAVVLNRKLANINLNRKMYIFLSFSIPTIICFFCIGIWHGAGWNFIVFGLAHAFFIILHTQWENLRRQNLFVNKIFTSKIFSKFSILLNFILVTILFVFFRSENLTQSFDFMSSMFGFNLISLPVFLQSELSFLENYGFIFNGLFSNNIYSFDNYYDNPIIWITILGLISFFGINIYEILNADLEVYDKDNQKKIIWKPNLKWSLITTILLFLSIIKLSDEAKFLYYQF